MSVFNIQASDIQDEINITGNSNLITIGTSDGDIPTATVLTRIARQETIVLARIPEKYRQMIQDSIQGEVLIQFADSGQTTAQTGLFPITNLVLFKNYFFNLALRSDLLQNAQLPLFNTNPRTYAERTKAYSMMPETDYTANLTTGAITITNPLTAGETIYADYSSSTAGAQCSNLVDIIIKRVAADILSDYPSESAIGSRIEAMKQQADNDLLAIQQGRAGVPLLDNLHLVDEEETRNANHIIKMPLFGGMQLP